MKLVLAESIVVGLMVVIMGNVVGFVVGKLMGTDLPAVCKQWNKNHVMEISLFLTGVLVHLLCEATGLNRWYCKRGAACRRR